MSLYINQNAWTKDPKVLVRELESRIDEETELGIEEPDHFGMQRLKGKLSKSKLIGVK